MISGVIRNVLSEDGLRLIKLVLVLSTKKRNTSEDVYSFIKNRIIENHNYNFRIKK